MIVHIMWHIYIYAYIRTIYIYAYIRTQQEPQEACEDDIFFPEKTENFDLVVKPFFAVPFQKNSLHESSGHARPDLAP